MLRLMIVDDEYIVRQGLKKSLPWDTLDESSPLFLLYHKVSLRKSAKWSHGFSSLC